MFKSFLYTVVMMFATCAVYAVDGTDIFDQDSGRSSPPNSPSCVIRKTIKDINTRLRDEKLSVVQKCELELRRAIEHAKFLHQKSSPEVKDAIEKLKMAQIRARIRSLHTTRHFFKRVVRQEIFC